MAQTIGPDQPTPAASAEAQMVDVDGHSLYLSCAGTGSPAVVYVHGLTQGDDYVPHRATEPIRELLADDFRVCLYDRRNSGDSDTVDAVQTPADMLHDMESVLSKGGVEPPYILMAASFGGLVAYDFLNHHPDQVSGLVLLDAIIPDELSLDQYLPPEATFQYFSEDDKCCTTERVSGFDLINGPQQYIGNEPDVPMIFLGAALDPRVDYDWGDTRIRRPLPRASATFRGPLHAGRTQVGGCEPLHGTGGSRSDRPSRAGRRRHGLHPLTATI